LQEKRIQTKSGEVTEKRGSQVGIGSTTRPSVGGEALGKKGGSVF